MAESVVYLTTISEAISVETACFRCWFLFSQSFLMAKYHLSQERATVCQEAFLSFDSEKLKIILY